MGARDHGDAGRADPLRKDRRLGLERFGQQDVEAVRTEAGDPVGLASLMPDGAADPGRIVVHGARREHPQPDRQDRRRPAVACDARVLVAQGDVPVGSGVHGHDAADRAERLRTADAATDGSAARGPAGPRGTPRSVRRRAHRGGRRAGRSADDAPIGRWSEGAAVSLRGGRPLPGSLARSAGSGRDATNVGAFVRR